MGFFNEVGMHQFLGILECPDTMPFINEPP